MALPNPFTRINSESPLSSFDCGDSDLNEFLSDDALNWQELLLTVTYCLDLDGEIILYFIYPMIKYQQIHCLKAFGEK